MALSELQDWIMRDLAARGGKIQAVPARAGVRIEDIEAALGGLQRRQYVSVLGPPNQNSDLGKDVDELLLLPNGVAYLRTLRR